MKIVFPLDKINTKAGEGKCNLFEKTWYYRKLFRNEVFEVVTVAQC